MHDILYLLQPSPTPCQNQHFANYCDAMNDLCCYLKDALPTLKRQADESDEHKTILLTQEFIREIAVHIKATLPLSYPRAKDSYV
jgi:hypothetical protein